MGFLSALYAVKLYLEYDYNKSLWQNLKDTTKSTLSHPRVPRSLSDNLRNDVIGEVSKFLQKHGEEEDPDDQSLLNELIDWLPAHLHLPGYEFCGPGTESTPEHFHVIKVKNRLDQACLEHDLAYINHKDNGERTKADKELLIQAISRIGDKETEMSEKKAAAVVAMAMLIKGDSPSRYLDMY